MHASCVTGCRYEDARCREFQVDDFGCLGDDDAAALITALHHSQWFTSVVVDDLKLGPAVLASLVLLVQRTSSIQELTLSGIGAKHDFWIKLAEAMGANTHQSINVLNISRNRSDCTVWLRRACGRSVGRSAWSFVMGSGDCIIACFFLHALPLFFYALLPVTFFFWISFAAHTFNSHIPPTRFFSTRAYFRSRCLPRLPMVQHHRQRCSSPSSHV